MKSTLPAAATRPTRWTAQVGFALLLAAFFVLTTLASASADQYQDDIETWGNDCTAVGGELIEMVDADGDVIESRCTFPSGSDVTCYWGIGDCVDNPAQVGPTAPVAGLGAVAVPVQDVAPVADPPSKPAAGVGLPLEVSLRRTK